MTRLVIAYACLVGLLATGAFADSQKSYPDLTGIWSTDNQQAAFAKTHPRLGDKLITAQQEFEIYRQEGSLLWAENRWRKDSSADWNIEYASGAFMPDSNDEFVFAEIGPPPPDGSATHTVFGEFEDGELHLTGVGNGVAFHSILRRQPR